MPTNQPLVSIVIPAYNCEKYILKTVESALNQTYKNIEVVISNDASSDQTSQVIASIKDPRVRAFFHEKNLGPEQNWNFCLKEAQGDYVKLLCCDDLIAATCIQRQVDVLESDLQHKISLVSTGRRIINQNGKVLGHRMGLSRSGIFSPAEVLRKTLFFGTNLLGEPGAGLFRRATGLQTQGFRGHTSYAIDIDFWYQLLAQGNLYYIREPLFCFRISGQSWSSRIGLKQYRQFIRWIDSVQAEKNLHAPQILFQWSKLSSLVQCALRFAVFRILARQA